jgi:hypothetical protein
MAPEGSPESSTNKCLMVITHTSKYA